ncbi:hypothetical protein [Streptomyces sp. AK02-01A]|uniref:hypothetical protein n=1 Tax=Streptomyces sp. AK02-01A TaxID=3028648 RepID=UPI0029B37BCE|nr:hypothetical protein [Streptomyces sp. AK02-01A]MDX3853573.1 hypothetical protein [Streptomyces sp. AK02-01A]
MVVYDRVDGMVARLDSFVGEYVSLSRPTGLKWQSRRRSVRQATEYEQRQFRAIGKLHRQQLKELPPRS